MRFRVILLCCLLGAPGWAGSTSLEGCIERALNAPLEVAAGARFTLATLCPDLDAAAASAVPLQEPLDTTVSLAQLLDLQAALHPGPTRSAWPLAPEILATTLKEMRLADRTPPSLWERFSTWLAERMPEGSGVPAWLEKVRLPDGAGELLFKLTVVGTLALALGLILNELRHVSFARGNRREVTGDGAGRKPEGPDSRWDSVAEWAGIDRLPVARQSAARLRYLIRLLDRQGLVPLQRAWTHREYVKAVQQHLPRVSGEFRAVAALGERVTFGHGDVTADEVARERRHAERVKLCLESARE